MEKAQNQVVLMSLSLFSRILHHLSPADSALPGAEHLVWPLAPTKAAESKARARASCQSQIAQICPDWNHLGCIRLGNLPSVLAYLLFIQGKCRRNKIYMLDYTDKIVSESGLVTLILILKLNIPMKTSLDFCCTK